MGVAERTEMSAVGSFSQPSDVEQHHRGFLFLPILGTILAFPARRVREDRLRHGSQSHV